MNAWMNNNWNIYKILMFLLLFHILYAQFPTKDFHSQIGISESYR